MVESLGGHPKPANGHTLRDIDYGLRRYSLSRYGQCPERREETTSLSFRMSRLVVAAHRASYRCTPRNCKYLIENSGDRGSTRGGWGRQSVLPGSAKLPPEVGSGQPAEGGLAVPGGPKRASTHFAGAAAPKPAKEVITDFGVGKSALGVSPDSAPLPEPALLHGTHRVRLGGL